MEPAHNDMDFMLGQTVTLSLKGYNCKTNSNFKKNYYYF